MLRHSYKKTLNSKISPIFVLTIESSEPSERVSTEFDSMSFNNDVSFSAAVVILIESGDSFWSTADNQVKHIWL